VDAALLDVNMPVMDGVEAAEFYRIAVPGGGGMPLIALTADATPQTRARCLQAGMAACLVKPVRTADLLDALNHALAAGSQAGAVIEAAPDALQILDLHTLADLQGLGGASFVELLVKEFQRDGAAVLEQLAVSCMERDVRAFRTHAHSLCSIAANVGAYALRDLCVPWKDLSETVLGQDAPALLASVRKEWGRTQRELQRYVTGLAPR
jgi:two-component system sensor histidine kinase RpfC